MNYVFFPGLSEWNVMTGIEMEGEEIKLNSSGIINVFEIKVHYRS